ncbi:MAG: type II toxin-antitoxin system VapC family toxin [Hyphomicrobiales bacterium]|nr:type II toxin-antitoxin system VapC family toxin [Hyphomicrobiales bacterium]
MIVLDTNVLSEGLRPNPDSNVRDWLNAQDAQELYLCTPVLAELHYGAERLPIAARRLNLERTFSRMVETFSNRVLTVDAAAAREYGRLMAVRDRLGRATGTMDGLIAAVASVHRAAVATRDVYGFDAMGIEVIDPFSHRSDAR